MNAFDSIVYKTSDGIYTCETSDGQVISESSTTPETVLQASLDRRGSIKWADTQYILSGSFSGLNWKGQTSIESSFKTRLTVPNGYAGDMFIMDLGANAVGDENSFWMNTVGGMRIDEVGFTPQKLWTGIHYKANSANIGVSGDHIRDLTFYNCNVGLLFDWLVDSSWMTSNTFRNMTFMNPKSAGVEWRKDALITDAIWTSSMTFDKVMIQYYSGTEKGWKNIHGNNHIYSGCEVWDFNSSVQPNPYTAEFTPYSTNQLILGGIMTIFMDNQALKGEVRHIDAHGPKPLLTTITELYQTNGDGVTRTFNIPHGKGVTPTLYSVEPISRDARTSPISYTADATNIIVTYTGTPPSPATVNNQNNVKLLWRANVG
ncbi:MAG: hypothetical protein L0H53_03860 [Candidatus Nitrosocosmicus sp.]|nr:hypothetical protein [Candidatus Nitrosocosmicus sp.]MDN5866238.1 hypothetical protein [Candidatus Nitrosocosmicus sp.]